MRIFITGVSDIGKTTIGTNLATNWGYCFYDLDDEIENYFGISIERLQNKYRSIGLYRNEAAKALTHILHLPESNNCIIALPPSGLMGGYWRVVKKTEAIIVVLSDEPENLLNRITFYDIDSQPTEKKLTEKEAELYLRKIKKDITYFGKSYVRAHVRIDISGLDFFNAAAKIEGEIKSFMKELGQEQLQCP